MSFEYLPGILDFTINCNDNILQIGVYLMKVGFTKSAYKSLASLPPHILSKIKTWVAEVEFEGIRTVRMRSGYHDEPLKGDRRGQRSIRLNRSYRIIYIEGNNSKIEIITVIEVSKHEY